MLISEYKECASGLATNPALFRKKTRNLPVPHLIPVFSTRDAQLGWGSEVVPIPTLVIVYDEIFQCKLDTFYLNLGQASSVAQVNS